MAAEQRFKLHFEATADTRGFRATTQESKTTATAVAALTTATKQHTAAVHADANGMRSWVSNARLTIPELQRQQRAQRAAAIQAAESQRQQNMKNYGQQMVQANRKQRTQGGGANGPTGGAGGGMGGRDPAMALLLASQGIEDAQYGIRGVLNNIPGLVMALGGGAGLAGALSIAAVAATTLWEKLGGGGAALEKSGLDKLKEMAAQTRAEFEALGDTIRDKFAAELKTTIAQAQKEMTAYLRSLESARKGMQRDQGRDDSAMDSALADGELETQRSIIEGTPEDEARRQQKEAERVTRQEHDRTQLQREQKHAVDKLEIASHGLRAGRTSAQSARDTLGGIPAARMNQIQSLAEAGVVSDQEQVIREYDSAVIKRNSFASQAAKAEQEVYEIDEQMKSTFVPSERSELTLRRSKAAKDAKTFRKGASEASATMDKWSPHIDGAREKYTAGQVTYNRAAESGLLPEQKYALEQGRANLDNLGAQEATAKAQLEAAQKQIADAGASIEDFKQEIEAATAKLQAFESRAAADNLEAARNAPLDAPLPALPGQAQPMPVLGPDLPAAPPAMPNMDVRSEADTIQTALRETQRLVSQAMTEMASTQTQATQATAQAVSSVRSQMQAQQAAIQQIKAGNAEQ